MIRSLKLPKTFPSIQIPPAIQPYIRPMLLASIGLHAAVLLWPLPSEPQKPKVAEQQKQKTVKLTTIPSLRKPASSLTQRTVAKTMPRIQAAALPQKGLVVPRPLKKRAPVKPASQTKPTPQSATSPKPTSQAASPLPGANESQSQGAAGAKGAMGDFPVFPAAVAGCLGLQSCFSTSSSLTEVAQFFEKELPLKKYSIQQSANDADRKVYQFSKGGESQYLTVLADGATTLYVVAPEPQTQASLRNAVQIPADFTENILTQLPTAGAGDGSSDVTPDQLTTPTDFFTSLGGADEKGFEVNPERNPEIDSLKLVPGQTPQQVYDSSFKAALTQSSYQSTLDASGYSGGLLYEIKKGTFKPFYLNLVPVKGGSGTVVIVWLKKPG